MQSKKRISDKDIIEFERYLLNAEKAAATIEKYLHDLRVFAAWSSEKDINKEMVLEYKQKLLSIYSPVSVNSIISSMNSFFSYKEWYDCRVKTVKIQKKIFENKEKVLTKAEYERLLNAAEKKKNKRLYMVMQIICSTGIRVSELKYITVRAVKRGRAVINSKGKIRVLILTHEVCRILEQYIKANAIQCGSVFVTRNGKPLDRSNIWTDMKKLCKDAGVSKEKVFPHNLRHLFARTFYKIQKDIIRLADVLGHSNVNTTRIYTMENEEMHRRQLQKLGLIRTVTTT